MHFSTLGFHDNEAPPSSECSGGGLYVYRSTDAGNNWTLPANGPAFANTQTVFRDKEYIAADNHPSSPFAGSLYMAWSNDVYSACPQNFATNFVRRDIVFSRSVDGGVTWSPELTLATGCLETAVPVVAANGDVYVVWFDCNSGIRQLVRKSVNGGGSFGTAVAAASGLTMPPNPLVGSNFRVNGPFPAIATDATNANNVYVTWSSDNGPSQTDVFVSRSLDGGTTWSPVPIRVNDDAVGNPRDQFMPWISGGSDGTVRVMWGDDRMDTVNAGGKLYDIFVAESADHATSFSPNALVTANSSNPDFDGFGGTFIGDYFGLSASGVPAWDDEQSGNQDIFGAPPADLIFKDGFASNDLSRWSSSATDGGDLSASAAAAMASTSFGLQALVNDVNPLFVRDDSPTAESRYRARFYVDPNGFDPGEAMGHLRTVILLAQDSLNQRVITIVLRRKTGSYSVEGRVRLDDGTRADTGFFPISDGPHAIEFDWSRSSGPGANDGSVELFIDGTSVKTLTGLDNDVSSIEYARIGAMTVKTGAGGTLYFDEFESRRVTSIGLLP